MNNIGTLVTAPIRPQSPTDKIPVAHQDEIKGGFRHVNTIAERDAIFEERRMIGMWCFVEDINEIYTLRGGITNQNWVAYRQGPILFKQTTPATKWIVNHNLGRVPMVKVFNSNRDEIMIAVEHSEDMNSMIIDFDDISMSGFVEYI